MIIKVKNAYTLQNITAYQDFSNYMEIHQKIGSSQSSCKLKILLFVDWNNIKHHGFYVDGPIECLSTLHKLLSAMKAHEVNTWFEGFNVLSADTSFSDCFGIVYQAGSGD